MVEVRVIYGDILQIAADVMLLTIDPDPYGKRVNTLDQNLAEFAGTVFRDKVTKKAPLPRRKAFHVTGRSHRFLPFSSVLYIVDDGSRPLNEMVYTGLAKAEEQRLKIVSLPLLGTDTLSTNQQAYREELMNLAGGIKVFCKSAPKHVSKINVVVHKGEQPALSDMKQLLEE